jgi:hypothetical protein
LLAMTACQPTPFMRLYSVLWKLACERWRPIDRPDSCGCTRSLWELACQRWRPDSRPDFANVLDPLWEQGLPAMAPEQPT